MIKLGENKEARILRGNVLDLLDKIPDDYFQLVVTSPPYNVGKAYEKKETLSSYMQFQSRVIRKMLTKIKENGSIVWQVGPHIEKKENSASAVLPLDYLYYPVFAELGCVLRNRIIWHYGHGLHCTTRFSGRYETCLWFTKTDAKDYVFNLDAVRVPSKYPNKKYYKGPKKGQLSCNPLGKNPSDYWVLEKISEEFDAGLFEITNVKHNHPEKTEHPCQYPVALAERFILALTNAGDSVFDPYGGSGTTVIAAIKNGRRGVMCEKEKPYIDIAVNRIKDCLAGRLKTVPIRFA